MVYRRRSTTAKEESVGIIDTKLPLSWLITSAVIVIMFMVGIALTVNNQSTSVNLKLDMLISGFAEQKKDNQTRDSKYDVLKDKVSDGQRVLDSHDLRITNVERAIATLPSKGK